MGGTAKKKKNHSIVGVPPTTPESAPCAPRVPSGWTGLAPQESTEAGLQQPRQTTLCTHPRAVR